MADLLLDVTAGATSGALLGALLEVGASLEGLEQAVAALGDGTVRLQVQGGGGGTLVRVRAPEGSPEVDDWRRLRPRIALLALDGAVIDLTLATLDALFAARGAVHQVPPEDVDVDPFSGLDDLAAAVALGAVTASLAPAAVRTTAVGHGTGVLETIEGRIQLPGPVVGELLRSCPTVPIDVTAELVDPVGAAYLAAVATCDLPDVPAAGPRSGHGRLPGRRGERVLTATLTD